MSCVLTMTPELESFKLNVSDCEIDDIGIMYLRELIKLK